MIEGRGKVFSISSKYITITYAGAMGAVYAPQAFCQSKFAKNDDVQFRAEPWDAARRPDFLKGTGVRYKANMVRYTGVSEKISDKGTVSSVDGKSIFIKYGKDEVYALADNCKRSLNEGDIVEFRAESWEKPPAHLSALGVRYRANSVNFLSKPRSITSEGHFSLIDSKGQYGFILASSRDPDGKEYSVFCTLGMLKPSCKNLNERFTTTSVVRFHAIEQAANSRNNMTNWRGTIVTDDGHVIGEDGTTVTSDPYANTRDKKEASKKQKKVTSASSTTRKPEPLLVESVSQPQYETAVSEQNKENNFSFTDLHISEDVVERPAEPSVPPQPDTAVTAAPAVRQAQNAIPNVACIPYSPFRSEFMEQNRKLRILAHYMTNYENCTFCLSHTHPDEQTLANLD